MTKQREIQEPNSCLSKAHTDETLFVLRAKDPSAPAAIRAWIEDRIRRGKNERGDSKITEAESCARTMEETRHQFTK